MARRLKRAACGTKENWNKHLNKFYNTHLVEPAEVYVSEDGLFLVTSSEWVEWLTGITDKVPEQPHTDKIIFKNGNGITIIPPDNETVRGKNADEIMFLFNK